MKKIFICSRFRGDTETNRYIAQKFAKIIIRQGNIPLAPHLYYTYFLDDNVLAERIMGITLGYEWLKECDEMWIISFDNELSAGMMGEVILAKELDKPMTFFGIDKSVVDLIIEEEMNKRRAEDLKYDSYK